MTVLLRHFCNLLLCLFLQHPFFHKQSIIRNLIFLEVKSEATKFHNKKILFHSLHIFPNIKVFQWQKTKISLHFVFNFRYCTPQELSRRLPVPREQRSSIGSFKAFNLSILCKHKIFYSYSQKPCHIQSTSHNQTWELNK